MAKRISTIRTRNNLKGKTAMTPKQVEAEIVAIAKDHGFEVEEREGGDTIALIDVEDINLTLFARELSLRLIPKAVKGQPSQ